MTEPLTGLSEAVEAAAAELRADDGGWRMEPEAIAYASRRATTAAYPLIAAAVRADERAKVEQMMLRYNVGKHTTAAILRALADEASA